MMHFCLKWRNSLTFGHHSLSDMTIIGILIFPGFQLLDAAGPISVFEIAARCTGKPLAIRVLALNAGAVRSSSGVEMVARDFRSANAITTLVVAGGEGVASAAR